MKSRRQFLKIGSLALGFVTFFGSAGRMFAIPRTSNPDWAGVVTKSVITCPVCKTKVQEIMSSEVPKRKISLSEMLDLAKPESRRPVFMIPTVRLNVLQIKSRSAGSKNYPSSAVSLRICLPFPRRES